jgi:hypothetical protein
MMRMTALVAGMAYPGLRDAIFVHLTMGRGFVSITPVEHCNAA